MESYSGHVDAADGASDHSARLSPRIRSMADSVFAQFDAITFRVEYAITGGLVSSIT